MTKQRWEKLLDRFPEANFLQSWAWGEFHQKLGNKIYRIAIPSKGPTSQDEVGPYKISGLFLAIVKNAKRGRYLEIPGGPLLSNYSSRSLWKRAVSLMKDVAIKENCVFIRIRPQTSDISTGLPQPRQTLRHELQRRMARSRNDVIPADALHSLGFRPAPMHLHAELTRVLDLTKTDEELLSEMRKSTRYEIRRVQKLGIKVEQSDDENLVDEFVKLQAETAKREEFVPFARKYLLEQFRAFKDQNSAFWFLIRSDLAVRQGQTLRQPISMAFVIFYHHEAVYHYAASNAAARKIPAAYALQWAIMQEAKKRGCITYNLWGDIPDDKLSSHRFAGPSLFKRGFGGRQVANLHAHDFPLSKRYWINWIIEEIRKYVRGLD